MEKRKLGKQGLEVSAIGFGCMGLSHAYGAALNEHDFREVVVAAIDAGHTFLDTAEVYGTSEQPHHNEDMLGKILPEYRNQLVIATKCGLTFDTSSDVTPYPVIPDSRPENIRKAIEGSLQRLHTDHIDLYYQHRPDPKVEPEVVAETMKDLIKEGKILYWGVSEAPADYIRRAHSVCPISAIQNRYSMMARWHESLFPLLEELGIGFVAFSPLANGLLSNQYTKDSHFNKSNDYRASMTQFQPESYEQNAQLLKLLTDLAAKKQATPAQIALAWVMAQRPWIVPIPGTRNLQRVRENAQAAEVKLEAEELQSINQQLEHMSMSGVFGGTKITARK
ncbi:MAG TPA: aldo/keto reductase [Candidatus Anaerobiospirillum pullistercoris]|uniref:Aldo/keto reductase n=1 Tax=Candidatus Anaerobiospirillum pullistercoris TaxID=2838452 RepID=A0A9D1WF17_9GAMM|nr:aldo/keto reductase [Candidatus Anaerobiospirillum pullistercoris]